VAFVSQNTVIPGFLSSLGAAPTVIGLTSSLQTAGWLLPQLFAARYLANKSYKKPYILLPAAVGRTSFLILALIIWSTRLKSPSLIIFSTILTVVVFWVGDGLASVPWFDLLSKAIPARRRGRLIGTAQVLSGLLGFFAGAVVEWMLSDRGPSFPNSYARLFTLGFVGLVGSFLALSLIAEEEGVSSATVPSWREFVPQLLDVLKTDRVFRRYVVARQLFGLSGLAAPFYMTFALDKLNLPTQVAGRYTAIGVVGSILAAIVFGWINERYGSKRVVQVSVGLNAIVPGTALLIPELLTDPTWLAWGYGLVFLAFGALANSTMSGWMNYILEWAPEAKRPTYVGLTNTINGLTILFSIVGGLVLQWSNGNYALLFVLTLIGVTLAWPLPFTLPEPRHAAPTTERAKA
jgi:MFS family permease